jgi:hypothetical protein
MNYIQKCLLLFLISILVTGCSNSKRKLLASNQSQVELRNIQTRAFDTTNKNKTLRTVIATLQDLGFVVDRADEVLGTVSGTKLDGYRLRITVSVRPRGDTQLLIRANAQYNLSTVEEPIIYQDFFTSLSKAMFLSAHSVE